MLVSFQRNLHRFYFIDKISFQYFSTAFQIPEGFRELSRPHWIGQS